MQDGLIDAQLLQRYPQLHCGATQVGNGAQAGERKVIGKALAQCGDAVGIIAELVAVRCWRRCLARGAHQQHGAGDIVDAGGRHAREGGGAVGFDVVLGGVGKRGQQRGRLAGRLLAAEGAGDQAGADKGAHALPRLKVRGHKGIHAGARIGLNLFDDSLEGFLGLGCEAAHGRVGRPQALGVFGFTVVEDDECARRRVLRRGQVAGRLILAEVHDEVAGVQQLLGQLKAFLSGLQRQRLTCRIAQRPRPSQ